MLAVAAQEVMAHQEAEEAEVAVAHLLEFQLQPTQQFQEEMLLPHLPQTLLLIVEARAVVTHHF